MAVTVPEATFTRPDRTGRRVVYVRFFDPETGEVIRTRSTGETTMKLARQAIRRIRDSTDFEAILRARKEGDGELLSHYEKLACLSVAEFVKWFWSDESDYLSDKEAAGTPLSRKYIETNRVMVRKYVEAHQPFTRLPVRELGFDKVDVFARELRRRDSARKGPDGETRKLSRYVVDNALDPLRTAISWACKRRIVRERIDFSGLVLPKREARERGILTDEEVLKIERLSVAPAWTSKGGATQLTQRPRPRLPGGATNEGLPAIDLRSKAYVLLCLSTGMRRGEARGLRWGSVDFQNARIRIESNWQDGEGLKAPKKGSFGTVPLLPQVAALLEELKDIAALLGTDHPDGYVLYNPKSPGKAVDDSALKRGWDRILRAIGISEDEQEARNLVPHGMRHRFVTKLADSGLLSMREVEKLARHRAPAMSRHYSEHIEDSTIAKGARAIELAGSAEAADGNENKAAAM